jgi:hypothetical protein
MSFWTTILPVLEMTWVIVVAVGLVLDRRSPAATLAWIGILAWLPLVGILVYYFFGPRRLRRRKMKRQEGSRLLLRAMRELDQELDDPRWTSLARMAIAAGESPPLPATDVTLYLEGDALYDALEAAIGAARHHIHVEYYIFEPDDVGRRMRDLLPSAPARGWRCAWSSTGSARTRSERARSRRSARPAATSPGSTLRLSGFRPRLRELPHAPQDRGRRWRARLHRRRERHRRDHSLRGPAGAPGATRTWSLRGARGARAASASSSRTGPPRERQGAPTGPQYFTGGAAKRRARPRADPRHRGPDQDLDAIHQSLLGAITAGARSAC